MTDVTFEGILFSDDVIIHTYGLITMNQCTLLNDIGFLMYKNQHEVAFTYKTAEIIPSVINVRAVNFINTSFHESLDMYLLSGIRTVNIISCSFVAEDVYFVDGNKSVDTVHSHYLKVLNVSIINTIFTGYQIGLRSYGMDSVILLKIINSLFYFSAIIQYEDTGYFSASIEDSKFYKMYLFIISQATSVSVRNCEYEVTDNIFYDNMKVIGNLYLSGEPVMIQKTIKLLMCPASHCENYYPTVFIENTMFT